MVLLLVPVERARAMSIYIDLTIIGEADLTLEVESGDSIDNVKQKIRNAGISTDGKYLYFGDRLLADGRTLADYNIQNKVNCDCRTKLWYLMLRNYPMRLIRLRRK